MSGRRAAGGSGRGCVPAASPRGASAVRLYTGGGRRGSADGGVERRYHPATGRRENGSRKVLRAALQPFVRRYGAPPCAPGTRLPFLQLEKVKSDSENLKVQLGLKWERWQEEAVWISVVLP